MIARVKLVLCSMVVLGFAPAQDAPAPPALHAALTPADRLAEEWWKQRFEATNERIRRGDVGLLFLGDSITQGWEDAGREVWDEFYGKRKAVNLGFSGDRTQHVLWRLERHGLELLAEDPPELAVVMIGTNNSNGADNSAQEIADGIAAIVGKLRELLPETRVLLLAIFPRNERPDAQREKIERTNAAIAKLADGKSVHFLDIGPKFLAEDGTLLRDLLPDFLHLSGMGYGIWAESIEPLVSELCGGSAPTAAAPR